MEPIYRISVTTLEKFRRYMHDVSVFDTEQALIDNITGVFKGTPKTEFGGAFHSILEGQFRKDKETIVAGGYYFTMQQARPALEFREAHPQIINEMNIRKVYETNFFPIQVSGRVDAVEGLAIRDAKAKFRSPDWHEYIDSCQWKFYLDMLGADIFYYDVFEIKGFKEESFTSHKLFPKVKILDPLTLECLRYPAMEKDILRVLNDFLEYVANRNFFKHLKPALPNEQLFS